MKKGFSLKDFKNAQERRKFLEGALEVELKAISNTSFSEDMVLGRNIENLIGSIQVPLGVAGPLVIKGPRSEKYFIPLATTEGALVASISRGCKAVTESGSATVIVENVGITRGPVFKTNGVLHSTQVKKWVEKNFAQIAQVTEKTSSHLKLLKIDCAIVGKNLFVRFQYDTGDAMGMNMATIATEQAVELIERETKAKCISLAGNFDIDKKPAWLNFINGRGKRAWAEVILKKEIVKQVLKTTPEKIAEVVYRKNYLGSIMSGSLGFNAHFANILAAIFIATGQDPAHVVEGSLGVTTAEVLENGDLYFSVYLPSLVVGTVGGGTKLPTQQEALRIMGVNNAIEYSRVVAAAVLSGELSLLASLAQGTLAKAHQKLGRKGQQK
ncbi:MAG: hydroxymethylglutaryl-CoA reductase (NADPH) [bacterium]|nr:hydroxymethylglutaryl-CoA reductase (NADPH) [bacterium]